LLAFLFVTPATAEAKNESDCNKCLYKKHAMKMYKKHDKHDKHDKKDKDKDSLKDKIFHKAHFYLEHKKDFGFSDEQIKQINDLKLTTKKSVIMKKAEIEVAALEIKSNLYYADNIDTSKINGLIDKKYDLKKEKTKTLVDAYATLKGIPTDNQKEKMKELKKKKQDDKW
ncbi:MAG: hypothetical protein KC713_04290, partial [Candidatus Omnitrophica bacterium]|nr:hypothetical protein [Candidatus Omnitrophota bacterium]